MADGEKKAYDLKELALKLKGHGLDVAEEGARGVVESLFDWLHESAPLSANPYDDMIDAAIVPKLKEFVLAQVDKIDGKVG